MIAESIKSYVCRFLNLGEFKLVTMTERNTRESDAIGSSSGKLMGMVSDAIGLTHTGWSPKAVSSNVQWILRFS